MPEPEPEPEPAPPAAAKAASSSLRPLQQGLGAEPSKGINDILTQLEGGSLNDDLIQTILNETSMDKDDIDSLYTCNKDADSSGKHVMVRIIIPNVVVLLKIMIKHIIIY